MRKEERTVEQKITVYIADDNTDFGQDEKACFRHDVFLRKKAAIERSEKLELRDFAGKVPINVDGSCGNNSSYAWYYMNNEEEFNVLMQAYDEEFPTPSFYPEVICVETPSGDMYVSEAHGYLLSDMKKNTVRFWTEMGYKIIIENE